MTTSTKDWNNYIAKMRQLNDTAANLMQEYVRKNGFGNTQAIIDYAYALVTKYGEGSAALAAQMYDEIAMLEGVNVAPAVPAPTPDIDEVGRAINGSLLQSPTGQKLEQVVGRLVKRTGADTTLNNAIRDGAQFAWIPSGDTCSFCLTLASRGWQYVSKITLKKGHAEHIHANCDCQYCVRFDNKSSVSGYNPDKYLDMYNSSNGTPKEKINAMRRASYAENKEKINAQKRAAYALRNGEAE